MNPSKFLLPHASFESIRKQARKLVRQMLWPVSTASCRFRSFLFRCETPSWWSPGNIASQAGRIFARR